MADDPNPTPPPSNGATPTPEAAEPQERPSLRDVAEASWNEVVEAAEDELAGQDGRARDSLGRYVAADQSTKPGEAAPQGTQPRPEISAPQEPQQHPAPGQPGSSSAAPANWPAEARANFEKLPPEMKSFVLERHSSMEGDYQRRVQANAQAAQFTSEIAPAFTDPHIAASLQHFGLSPAQAVMEWAGFHRAFIDPNPAVRLRMYTVLGQQLGLDPAAAGQRQPAGIPLKGLTEADLADPAIRTFAEHIGSTSNEVQALRQELHQLRQHDVDRQNAEVLKATRWSIDAFAEEKGSDGQKLHPHFDSEDVMEAMMRLLRANPDADLKATYEEACWMAPSARTAILAAQAAQAERAKQTERAKQAVRSNLRGITSPVSKPTASNGTERKGLRATIEEAAEEVGM